MKIGIGLRRGAYTPEAYAYRDYLSSKGVSVQLEYEDGLYEDNYVNLYFMGFRPFFKNRNKKKCLEIHEYQSLSTPPFAGVKDFLKRSINSQPNGRIFLNEVVKEQLEFNDSIQYICRDMGVDKKIYQEPSSNAEFDIVYCGSISGRAGLIEEIYRLVSIGFRLLIVGDIQSDIKTRFVKFGNRIVFAGRVERHELPEIYKNCRAGLNYTPDLYPFNIQTSTKTLEYLAAGLMVLTNRYNWSNRFFEGKDGFCVFLDEINSYESLQKVCGKFPDIHLYEWDAVLERSNLYDFIMGLHR
ncbi:MULTISPECIES: glycosyltransferase family 4 protein [Aeromonas]|uniref:glycosyltransferase family 4 protein n=1 Tax=Aeromonas TaxID=642 RepID=UPI00227C39F7|nr:glycosyltransferase family 4 protein [Aeromonas hydrophila]ELM3717394.1 glycosyltransferase family 4 protein [Aeromonas hydrophila]WAF89263.1 glycosyltransferase family 4 protein [Aeromonas hydrophila]WAG01979.1 glycosyltransferase family 4 protein [Aeromonas hydrophila]